MGLPGLLQPPCLPLRSPPGLTSSRLAPARVEASHPAALEDVGVPAASRRAGAQHLRAQRADLDGVEMAEEVLQLHPGKWPEVTPASPPNHKAPRFLKYCQVPCRQPTSMFP